MYNLIEYDLPLWTWNKLPPLLKPQFRNEDLVYSTRMTAISHQEADNLKNDSMKARYFHCPVCVGVRQCWAFLPHALLIVK